MTQERLSNLSLFSLEYDVFVDVDFETIIDDFPETYLINFVFNFNFPFISFHYTILAFNKYLIIC